MSQSLLIFPLFGNAVLAEKIHQHFGYEIGKITFHQFPDEETAVRIDTQISNRDVVLIASLDRPNPKIFPLVCAAETAREFGAKKVRLIAPYLAYMRQDKSFYPGEGITSKYFAKLISRYFDELITIDPHLHRWHSLNEIYTIPTKVLHATESIATWIKQNTANPVLIGPDVESRQWVSEIAEKVDAPFLILEKIRKGDSLVKISIPQIELYSNHTPILIDDIISTAMTMIQAVQHLKKLKTEPPICIGVHAIFADFAYDALMRAGALKIVTCNTIAHPSNHIDISDIVINVLYP